MTDWEFDDEHYEQDWISQLDQFERELYPAFRRHGFPLWAAFMCMKLNEVSRAVSDLRHTIEDNGDFGSG